MGGFASVDDRMEVSALCYECDGVVDWVFGVGFCGDIEYDEDDWYPEWDTYGGDYEFEEEIEFEEQYEFEEQIEFAYKSEFVVKNEFVDSGGFVDKNESVDKIGLDDKIGLKDRIAHADNAGPVEDYAELVFERVEDDDDCTNDVANVFGIEILESTDIIGSLCHTHDGAPLLDSGSMLRAPFPRPRRFL